MDSKLRNIDSIGFIGGGSMGLALAKAIRSRFPESVIHVCDIRPQRVALFQQEVPGARAERGPAELAEGAEVVFIAVKPQDIQSVLKSIRNTDRLVISIAAGINLKRLESVLGGARIARVMPNTPCLIGAMAAGYAFGARIRPQDRESVRRLLGAAGFACEVEERLLDAVTGLSGSGPAFVARLIEAFIKAGVELDLDPRISRELAIHTFLGTARLLAETGMQPQDLVEMVSSPKGTTVAGREILESSDCASVIAATIKAAARRSEELGK